MLRISDIILPLEHSLKELEQEILIRLNINRQELTDYKIYKRGYDARQKHNIKLTYTLDVETTAEARILQILPAQSKIKKAPPSTYQFVTKAKPNIKSSPIIIGSGPCGLLAGLVLAQMGFCPLILERGQAVDKRLADINLFEQTGRLDPESNIQFGEGGAGTFSDGKLYTQIKDSKNRMRKVLDEFIQAGAPKEIGYISKPHIGTSNLVKMVKKIRKKIEQLGGKIRFGCLVESIDIKDSQVHGLRLADGEYLAGRHIVLAIGHSARDSFAMLDKKQVCLEPKPFSIGVRIEHPQQMIDRQRFGDNAGHSLLGAADYKLVHHCRNGRSVYSFCMCPGGRVVAATSELGSVVTNGMSEYERNQTNANSAIVVGVSPQDYGSYQKLAGVDFQRRWEQKAYKLAGSNYMAPAQLVGDFLADRASTKIEEVEPSYKPGITLSDLSCCLPQYVILALREALPAFECKIKGFAIYGAVMTGVETRTSSPLRILRDKNFQSSNIRGLYPAGEGAGYAGGIVSSAIDGIRVAEAVALNINSNT